MLIVGGLAMLVALYVSEQTARGGIAVERWQVIAIIIALYLGVTLAIGLVSGRNASKRRAGLCRWGSGFWPFGHVFCAGCLCIFGLRIPGRARLGLQPRGSRFLYPLLRCSWHRFLISLLVPKPLRWGARGGT